MKLKFYVSEDLNFEFFSHEIRINDYVSDATLGKVSLNFILEAEEIQKILSHISENVIFGSWEKILSYGFTHTSYRIFSYLLEETAKNNGVIIPNIE